MTLPATPSRNGVDWGAIRAVVFDLDDTLVNWREAEHGALGDLCRTHFAPAGHAEAEVRRVYAGVMAENFRAFRSDGRWWFIADRLQLLVQRLDARDLATDLLVADFKRHAQGRLRLLPGALDALRASRASGRRVGLLTNGHASVQRPKIEAMGLHGHLDVVGITGDIGHWKPAPQAFLHVLARLGVEPAQAAMVGDSVEFDLEPAKGLGMATVWVNPSGGRHPAADAVVPAPSGLVGLL